MKNKTKKFKKVKGKEKKKVERQQRRNNESKRKAARKGEIKRNHLKGDNLYLKEHDIKERKMYERRA